MKRHRIIIFSLWFTSIATAAPASELSVTLRIPENQQAVGVFQEFRTLRDEYELLSMVQFESGDHIIPIVTGEHVSSHLIERFEFGPQRTLAEPQSPGEFFVDTTPWDPNARILKFEQPFKALDQTITLKFELYLVIQDNGALQRDLFVLDDDYLDSNWFLEGLVQTGTETRNLRFGSVKYESLPLWRIDVQLEGEQFLKLYQRYQVPMAGSGPAKLVYAEGGIDEGPIRQSSYWRLIYSAGHHNWDEKFWVLFDEPLGEAYGIAVITEEFPFTVTAYTLDSNLNPLRTIEVVKYTKAETSDLIPDPTTPVPDWGWHK
ncbi:MAG TPA: hypothetical protein PK878_14340 [bacterium]|nr:hypothetical protein [bacterium]